MKNRAFDSQTDGTLCSMANGIWMCVCVCACVKESHCECDGIGYESMPPLFDGINSKADIEDLRTSFIPLRFSTAHFESPPYKNSEFFLTFLPFDVELSIVKK